MGLPTCLKNKLNMCPYCGHFQLHITLLTLLLPHPLDGFGNWIIWLVIVKIVISNLKIAKNPCESDY